MAFASSSEAKQNKWFSRRNQTSQGLTDYRIKRDAKQQEKDNQARVRDALARQRTPREQIARLDAKLGKGKGAARERNRLAKLIATGHGDQKCLGPALPEED